MHRELGSPPACHCCGSLDTSAFEGFEALPAVTSDCRPWQGRSGLLLCRGCGLVQKRVDPAWREQTAKIYQSYCLYHQSSDTTEQLIFSQTTGKGVPRSELVLEALFEHFRIPNAGTMIDLGCGTGPTLRAFSGRMEQWQLYGYDPHLPDRERVLEIPGVRAVFSGALSEVGQAFDLLTAIHVLEHVPEPLSFLKRVRCLMKPTSLLLVQVPHYVDTPFDLTVVDHCSHFTPLELERTFARAGLKAELMSTTLVAKEISVVARLGDHPLPEFDERVADPSELNRNCSAVRAGIQWLSACREQAEQVGHSGVGVFGTSIGANWLLGLLGERLRFFVDEDEGRVGTTYRGRQVYAPHQVPPGTRVLMPLE